jgi:hypothetical protein
MARPGEGPGPYHVQAKPEALGVPYADGHARAYFAPAPYKRPTSRGVSSPGHAGDLGDRRGRGAGVYGDRRVLGAVGRRAAPCSPICAPSWGRTANDGLLRPRRLVTGPPPRSPPPGTSMSMGGPTAISLSAPPRTCPSPAGPAPGSPPAVGAPARCTLPRALAAAEVAWRMSARWRENNDFRYPAPTSPLMPRLLRRHARRSGPDGAKPGEKGRRPPGWRPPSSRRSRPPSRAAQASQPGPGPGRDHDQPRPSTPCSTGRRRLRRVRHGQAEAAATPAPIPIGLLASLYLRTTSGNRFTRA